MTISKRPTMNAIPATLVPSTKPNQRKMDRINKKIKSSKLGQKLQKVSSKARKLTSKIPTLKDPAKRQKAIQRLERVNQRVTKRGKKAINRFTKKMAQSSPRQRSI